MLYFGKTGKWNWFVKPMFDEMSDGKGETDMISSPFSEEELLEIRSKFYDVERDFEGRDRLFFDNAGGSLRLRAAEEIFHRLDQIPDCSEHSNRVAKYLDAFEQQGRRDLMECVFNARHGVLYPSYTASQIMMELCRVISANAKGSNVVTTMLEHPSSYDGMKYYAGVYGREFRVAGVNPDTGGVDADTVISLIDENTAILSCMYASNISGFVYDLEKICLRAREINPDIFIICDAVQHAPHGVLDPEKYGIDAMNFAPYKFFGIRGFSVAYISDRAASFMHHRLLGKEADDWSIGSPAPAHYAAISEIVRYVIWLGEKELPGKEPEEKGLPGKEPERKELPGKGPIEKGLQGKEPEGKELPGKEPMEKELPRGENASRRELFVRGMNRIAQQERALLNVVLEGTDRIEGLRHMKGVRLPMDGADLNSRDFIIGVEFDRFSCEQAVAEYEKRGIITFERTAASMYSRRMVEAFGSGGVVRISPLHVNTMEEMEKFLQVTKEIAQG